MMGGCWGNDGGDDGKLMGGMRGGIEPKFSPDRKPKIIIFGIFGKEIDHGTMLDRSGVPKYVFQCRYHQKWLAGSRDMAVFCFGGCLGVWGGCKIKSL